MEQVLAGMGNIATETATALGFSVDSSNRVEGAAAKKDDNVYSPVVGRFIGLS